jgi:hypothetical protein
MGLSFVEYTTSGTGPYPVTFHLRRSLDLAVTLEGTPLAEGVDYTVDSSNLNVTLLASSTGELLRLERDTPRTEAGIPVTFTQGAAITKANLDDTVHHLEHQIQELTDDFDDLPPGPQGPPGDDGAQGPPGDDGAQGPPGTDGVGDETSIFMGL